MTSETAKHENRQESPAAESLKQEQKAQREAAQKVKNGDLTEALEDTFPASDPVASQSQVTPGKPD